MKPGSFNGASSASTASRYACLAPTSMSKSTLSTLATRDTSAFKYAWFFHTGTFPRSRSMRSSASVKSRNNGAPRDDDMWRDWPSRLLTPFSSTYLSSVRAASTISTAATRSADDRWRGTPCPASSHRSSGPRRGSSFRYCHTVTSSRGGRPALSSWDRALESTPRPCSSCRGLSLDKSRLVGVVSSRSSACAGRSCRWEKLSRKCSTRSLINALSPAVTSSSLENLLRARRHLNRFASPGTSRSASREARNASMAPSRSAGYPAQGGEGQGVPWAP